MQLQNLAVCITKTEYENRVRTMVARLRQEGMCAEERSAAEIAAWYRKEKETPAPMERILVLTDSREVCNTVLSQDGFVMLFLHEGNRNVDFPHIQYAAETLEELDATYFERIYCRLAGLPWEILETDRCILRETIEEDVDAFYEIYQEPSVTAYTEPLYKDKEKEKQYVRDYRKYGYGYYEFGIWTVLEKTTGQVIGRAGINMRDGFEIPEIGFVIGVPWQHKGIAYEVCEAVIAYAKEMLFMDTLQALVLPDNLASVRLCEKLGFRMQEDILLEDRMYCRFLLQI